MWDLSSKDPEYLKGIESWTDEEVKSLPEAGDGKATFIPFMTEVERDEFLKNQEPLWKKVSEKLKKIIKS